MVKNIYFFGKFSYFLILNNSLLLFFTYYYIKVTKRLAYSHCKNIFNDGNNVTIVVNVINDGKNIIAFTGEK